MSSVVSLVSARAEKYVAEPLILLHGWGCDSRSWQPILDGLCDVADIVLVDLPGFAQSPALLPEATLDQWLEALMAELPPKGVYLGWSLGGMMCREIARRYPQRVSRLITLSTNLSFVQRPHWQDAMPVDIFRDFYGAFGDSPEVTLKRFCGLMASGDADERKLLVGMRAAVSSSFQAATPAAWLSALQILAEIDHSSTAESEHPALHILGANDTLVPVAIGTHLQSGHACRVEILPNCAHAPHWSYPQEVLALIDDFLQAGRYALNKQRVASSFSKAASSYDSVAALQRRVGNRLLDLLPIPSTATRLLDLGSGTGFFTGPLAKSFDVCGLDIAAGMIEYARCHHETVPHWVCGDAEQLPFANDSFDIIFSSLAIQWCADLPLLFAELARVLKPGCQAFIATLGPETLYELRDAWKQVDAFAHVNQFASLDELALGSRQAGLNVDVCHERIRLYYQELKQLTHELKALGAHNMNPGQSSGLTGRHRVAAFKSAYEHFRVDGLLPATYDVIYLTLTKPHS